MSTAATHRQLPPGKTTRVGVSEETERLSIGIAHIDGLLADFDQALVVVA